MSSSPGSGPLTITFSKRQSNCQWIVSQWDGVDITGVNGAGAIGQTGSTRGDAVSGLTVSHGAFENPNNVAYGVFGVRSSVAAVTPGAGFTELGEQPSAESPPSDLEAEWAPNLNTIAATWTALNAAALGVEIRAGHAGPGTAVVSVDVTPSSANVAVGGTVQLTATAKNAEGEPLPGGTFTWLTDAPAVATVSAAGLVTGVGAGSATITATSEGKSGTASVTVTANTAPVASVEVTPASASVPVGGTVQLTATTRDAADQVLTGRTVTWTTNAPGVATVSATGLVAGVAEGPATITATSEGKSGAASVTVTAGGQAALVGEWSSVLPAPTILIHLHLLPDGRVLIIGRNGPPQVWNPATGTFIAAPSPSLVFCAGHDFLPDGRLLVAGGHISSSRGLPNTNIFDWRTNSWQVGPPMAQGRWYPTNTTLPNGEVLTLSGVDESGAVVPLPEVWDGTSWRQLATAAQTLPNYPRTFVAPDGRVFYAGSDRQSRYLDVTGTGSWT
ncbi:MAG: Ig-like domain-containing protein, partial [Gammaproteobacteria bacterium]